MWYSVPGVYITEPDAFGTSAVGVATAEPAFIGYTEMAIDPATGKALVAPIRITTLVEYQSCFGGAAIPNFVVTQTLSATPAFTANITMADGAVVSSGFDLSLARSGGGPDRFCLFRQMQLFFANGGGVCWVMSAGSHAAADATITAADLLAALDAVGKTRGPTMLVVPEACQLPQTDYASVVCAMLEQADKMRDRVAILDLPGCLEATNIAALTAAQQNLWRAIAPQADHLSYGVAYAPALATTLVQPRDVRFPALVGDDNRTMNAILTTQAVHLYSGLNLATLQSAIATAFPVADVTTNTSALSGDSSAYPAPVASGLMKIPATDPWLRRLDDLLTNALPIYVEIDRLVADYLNVQPPSGAMAGVWCATDAASGVWNAPANVTLTGVAAPICPIDDTQQVGFNAPINGMAIDVLRAFPARGTVVWGARTLDGNSPDYRYIPVRRTLIYIDQSVKQVLQNYVFAANDAATWTAVTASLSSFLTGIWQQGGLIGATASEAFTVKCGLGTEMSGTGIDALNAHMVIAITLQLTHPGEFVELTIAQLMQTN